MSSEYDENKVVRERGPVLIANIAVAVAVPKAAAKPIAYYMILGLKSSFPPLFATKNKSANRHETPE